MVHEIPSHKKLYTLFPMKAFENFISLTRVSPALPSKRQPTPLKITFFPFPPPSNSQSHSHSMPSSFSSSTSLSPSHSWSSASSFISPRPMARGSSIEQLHFDVPLISTRRSTSANASKSSHLGSFPDAFDDYIDTSRSVPFSWEAAPGVPKGSVARASSSKEDPVSAPKPPPGRSRPLPYYNADRRSDDGNRSLSGPLDGPRANRAPSFIMNRFLPAANALAAASLSNAGSPRYAQRGELRDEPAKPRRRQRAVQVDQCGYRPRDDARPVPAPSSGCGLVDLFPPGLKSVICRFKGPVACQTPKLASLEAFAPRSRRINAGDGLSSDDGLSSKACKSPGWGLPLLDTSRLRIRGLGVDLEEGRRSAEGRTPRTGRRLLPMLRSPKEPWLANAMYSANRNN